MEINQFLIENCILMDVDVTTKEQIIHQLVKTLKQEERIDDEKKCFEDIMQREKQISTGLVEGIAIPHAQSSSVKIGTIAIAKIINTVEWETLDKKDVKVVLLITVPKESQNEHLKILSILAEKLMDTQVCQSLVQSKTKKEIMKILSE